MDFPNFLRESKLKRKAIVEYFSIHYYTVFVKRGGPMDKKIRDEFKDMFDRIDEDWVKGRFGPPELTIRGALVLGFISMLVGAVGWFFGIDPGVMLMPLFFGIVLVVVAIQQKFRYERVKRRLAVKEKIAQQHEEAINAHAQRIAEQRDTYIQLIVPTMIRRRMWWGNLNEADRFDYVEKERSFILSREGEIKSLRDNGFDVSATARAAVSAGTLPAGHGLNLARWQVRVNDTIEELWRDLVLARRWEVATKPNAPPKDPMQEAREAAIRRMRKEKEEAAEARDIAVAVWREAEKLEQEHGPQVRDWFIRECHERGIIDDGEYTG
jgi:hypothetical protein